MDNAPTEITTPNDPAHLLGRFDRVEIRTMSEARATLRDGSLIVHVSATAEIAYNVRRPAGCRVDEVLVQSLAGGRWHDLDPAWQLPATIIYTPQNNIEESTA